MNKIKEWRDPSMPIQFVEMQFKELEGRKRYGHAFWES